MPGERDTTFPNTADEEETAEVDEDDESGEDKE